MAASILSNTAVATAGRLINSGLGVVVVALISRLLGVADFGTYSLVLAYGAMVQIVADGGLYLTLSRLISTQPEQEDHFLRHIFSMRTAALSVAFGVGVLGVLLIPALRHSLNLYLIAAFGFFAQSLSQLFMSVFQKYGVIWRATLGDLVARLLQILGLLLISAGYASLSLVIAIFSLSALAALILHRLLLRGLVSVSFSFNWPLWRSLFAQSWPLAALLVVNTIYFRIDTLILSFFRSSVDVGLYSLAYRVVESALFFPAMFGGLLLPALTAALAHRQQRVAEEHYNQSLILFIWSSVAAALIIFFCAPDIILLIAGPAYLDAVPLLITLGFALAAMMIGNLSGFTMVALELQKAMLTLSVCLACFNFFANLALIPQFGAPAAALTTLFTEVGAALIGLVIISRYLAISVTRSYLVRLFLCAIVSVFMASLVPSAATAATALARLLVVSSIFIGATLIFQPFRLADIRRLTHHYAHT